MSEDNKLKLLTEELKMLQDIVKRMADNSFKMKGWAVALIAIAIIFRAHVSSIFVSIIPLLAFSYLDAYYLLFERRFRDLYNKKVDKFQKGDFKEIFKFNINGKITFCDILDVYKSQSVWVFYGGIFILVLIFECLNKSIF